jgi:predicted ATPase
VLIEFRVENHRSIASEQVLGLQAVTRDNSERVPRLVAGLAEALLPAVALYGANASGKTNVLRALDFMRSAVVTSYRLWDPEEGVRREPFAWGPTRGQPSTFEVAFVAEGTRYEYGFVADDASFLEEWLFAYPKGRKQTWFERDGAEFKFSENLIGENNTVKEVTRPNALFLSTAAQLQHKQMMPVFHWFRGMLAFNLHHPLNRGSKILVHSYDGPSLEGWLESSRQPLLPGFEDDRLSRVEQLLREADVGISAVGFEPVSPSTGDGRAQQRRQIRFLHKTTVQDAWLPLEQESDGTRTLVRLAPGLIDALQKGSVLLIDELESSLHPLLAMKLIRLFNDPRTNPRNAQIIFTTHDTNLLGSVEGDALLRRDQIWLTEKDDEGATSLYPLTDYKPRKAENLERGYLQGRYGAIPFLGALLPEEK